MQALSGIRALDISQMWAAPATAIYLADHGARIIKVELLGGNEGREPRAPADRALAMLALQPLTAGVYAAGTGERTEMIRDGSTREIPSTSATRRTPEPDRDRGSQ